MLKISKEEARDFLVNYQELNGKRSLKGHDGALEYMKKVRCIQFDPLDVVGRNPDLVLQSRIESYTPSVLEDLLYRDRVLVDGADKVLSIVMTEDYPQMTRVRQAATQLLIRTLTYRDSLNALDLQDEVREYIRDNGPLPASRIDIGGRAGEGRWGHKKLSSATLDYMFHSGQLGIRSKIKTQKVYDLIDNLLPEDILCSGDPFADEHDFLKWYVKKRIGSIGMVWNKNTGAWVGEYLGNRSMRSEILDELVNEGEIIRIWVEGSSEPFYIRTEDQALLGQTADNNVVKFIAPLDNLIWDRGMVEEIFGFKYSWEVYTPTAKRQYGYYVLPVLYKNRFIARFEPDKFRGKGPLTIKNWWWEENEGPSEDLNEAVKEAFSRFAVYLGAEVTSEYQKLLIESFLVRR